MNKILKVRKPKSLRTILVKKVLDRFYTTKQYENWEDSPKMDLEKYLGSYLSFHCEVLYDDYRLDEHPEMKGKIVESGKVMFKDEEDKIIVIDFCIKSFS